MLQNLLAERFHLVVHHETRNCPGYELVVAKGGPKLKEAIPDPQANAAAATQHLTHAKDGSIVLPPGPRTWVSARKGVQRVQYQERSMAELAASLGSFVSQERGADFRADQTAPRARVVDKTGLTGKYDFTLEYSCLGCRGIDIPANLPLLAAAKRTLDCEHRSGTQESFDGRRSGNMIPLWALSRFWTAGPMTAQWLARRLITLIFSGRNRRGMIRRELPRTSSAGWIRGSFPLTKTWVSLMPSMWE